MDREIGDCPRCGRGLVFIETPDLVHYGKDYCNSCNRMARWVPMPKNENERGKNKHTPASLNIAYCQMCMRTPDMLGARETLEPHHVVEIQHGGEDEPANIWILCTACHRAVHHSRTYLYEHHKGTMTLARLRVMMEADNVPPAVRPQIERLFKGVRGDD